MCQARRSSIFPRALRRFSLAGHTKSSVISNRILAAQIGVKQALAAHDRRADLLLGLLADPNGA